MHVPLLGPQIDLSPNTNTSKCHDRNKKGMQNDMHVHVQSTFVKSFVTQTIIHDWDNPDTGFSGAVRKWNT